MTKAIKFTVFCALVMATFPVGIHAYKWLESNDLDHPSVYVAIAINLIIWRVLWGMFFPKVFATRTEYAAVPLGASMGEAIAATPLDAQSNPELDALEKHYGQTYPLWYLSNIAAQAQYDLVPMEEVIPYSQNFMAQHPMPQAYDITATCRHEAGHAVVALARRRYVDTIVIRGSGEGWTSYRGAGFSHQARWDELVITLAGLATEKLYDETVTGFGSDSDLSKANVAVTNLYQIHGIGDSEKEVLRLAMKEASTIIQENQKLVDALTEHLLSHPRMLSSSIARIAKETGLKRSECLMPQPRLAQSA